MFYIQIVSHVAITLVAVVSLALRIEHRLTKIETDVTWLKKNVNNNCNGDCDNEDDSKVDQP
jgi:hypothetical protein